MIRVVLWLVGAIVAISLLRGVIGMFGKLAGDFLKSPAPGSPKATALKKCPSCGTYTPDAYCSEACRKKAA